MADTSLQKRVAALEAEVAALKATVNLESGDRPWWQKIWGAFQDDPAFKQAMEFGRQYRESQQRQSSRIPNNDHS